MNLNKLHWVWILTSIVILLATPLVSAKPTPIKINGIQMPMAKTLNLPSTLAGRIRVVAQFAHPLSPQDRQTIQVRGIRFEQYLASSAYMVSGDRDTLLRFADEPSLAGIGMLPAEAKIDMAIRVDLPSSSKRGSLQPMDADTMPVKVLFQETTPFSTALEILQKHGASLESGQTGYNFRETLDCVSIPKNRILSLAGEESVLIITEVDPPIVPCNLNAQDTSNVDEIHPGGLAGYDLDGTGVTVGEWDPSGARTTHSQLIGRATQEDGAVVDHFHATHVAGTIAASGIGNTQTQGMAPNASLLCWDCVNHLAEMDANAHRIVASNHSYAFSTGWQYDPTRQEWHWYGNSKISPYESHLFGRYSTISLSYDRIVYDHDQLVVVAAGNNRVSVSTYWGTSLDSDDEPLGTARPMADGDESDDGYDTLNSVALGKNIITVGAIHDRLIEPPTPELECIASWSSWGPTDDGRIKPDLAANGVKLLSLDTDSDTSTRPQSGTSMAAPVVTGTIACLVQQYRQKFSGADPSCAVIKNIILHTAQDEGTPPGPDYRIGWGLLDAKAAANFIHQMGAEGTQLAINSYEGTPIEIPVEYIGEGPIKVTMVWTDPPGTAILGGLDESLSTLVNDLDLTLNGVDTIYYPWTLDPANPSQSAKQDRENHRDNVEQVLIAKPKESSYILRIGGQLNWGSSQIYTLCLSGLRLPERESQLLILQPVGQRRTTGITPIHLFAASDAGIVETRIDLDGQVLDDPLTSEVDGLVQFATPQVLMNYRFQWNTKLVSNGEHRLAMSVKDASERIFMKEMSVFILNEFSNDASRIDEYHSLILDATDTLQELDYTNDRDWYWIQISESGFYTIETHPIANFPATDTELVLYGPDNLNLVLQEDDDGGIDVSSRIIHWLDAHRDYYVRVGISGTANSSQSSGLYGITLTPAQQADSSPVITPVDVNGATIDREIEDIGDIHWFRFTAPYLCTCILEATPVEPAPVPSFQFELFKPDDTNRALNTGNFQKPIFRVMGDQQEFLVKVSARKAKGKYNLSIRTLSELSIHNLTINGPAKTGEFHTGGIEEAWYVLYSPAFTTYRMEFNTTSSNLAASTAFILYGPDDPTTEIVHTETEGSLFTGMFLPLRGYHFYYLQVFTRKGNGSYTIRVRNPQRAFPMTRSLFSISDDDGFDRSEPNSPRMTPVGGWMLY